MVIHKTTGRHKRDGLSFVGSYLLQDLVHGRLTDSPRIVGTNCPRNHEWRGWTRHADNWSLLSGKASLK